MRKYIGTLALVLSVTLAGCGSGAAQTGVSEKTAAEETQAAEEKAEEKTEGAAAEIAETSGTGDDKKTAVNDAIAGELAAKKEKNADEKTDVFAEMAGWEFEFTSGAGAWATELAVNADGTFSGTFHDANMGETGEGYEENGTLYLSEFTGKFGEAKEREPFIYEVSIEEINYKNTPETEKIEDGTKYIYAEAYEGYCDYPSYN